MAELRWSERLEVGVGSIDDGHHGLAALIDALERAVSRGEDPREVQDLLVRLVGETRDHFAVEEQLMDAYVFPGRAAHVKEHARLLQEVASLLGDHATRHRRLTTEMARSLGKSFMDHIQRRDLPLGGYLRGRQSGGDDPQL